MAALHIVAVLLLAFLGDESNARRDIQNAKMYLDEGKPRDRIEEYLERAEEDMQGLDAKLVAELRAQVEEIRRKAAAVEKKQDLDALEGAFAREEKEIAKAEWELDVGQMYLGRLKNLLESEGAKRSLDAAGRASYEARIEALRKPMVERGRDKSVRAATEAIEQLEQVVSGKRQDMGGMDQTIARITNIGELFKKIPEDDPRLPGLRERLMKDAEELDRRAAKAAEAENPPEKPAEPAPKKKRERPVWKVKPPFAGEWKGK